MANGTADGTCEAYKQIIEFTKVIISLASTILTALMGYLVFEHKALEGLNLIGPILLVISILFSLQGFGKAIKTVKTGVTNQSAILYTNLGAGIMILGIISISFIKPEKEISIDSVLEAVSKSSTSLKKSLFPENCDRIDKRGEDYVIHYKADSLSTQVVYSVKENRISSIQRVP